MTLTCKIQLVQNHKPHWQKHFISDTSLVVYHNGSSLLAYYSGKKVKTACTPNNYAKSLCVGPESV